MGKASVNEQVQAKVEQILRVLGTDAPGMFQSAIGGEEVELDGQRVLANYDLVGVPTNEFGLPEAREVLFRGWTSYKNTTVQLSKEKNSAPAGTWQMPMVINGKVKYLQGTLMVLRPKGGVAKWTYNVGIRNNYERIVKDEDGKPTGETKEETNWVQPIRVDDARMDNAMELALQRTAYDAMGAAIALSNNITFTVE